MSFSLSAAVGIATGGLAAINTDFGIISNNLANANTVGYSTEQSTQSDLDASGQGIGVRSGPTRLVQDQALQNQLNGQTATASGAQVTDAALANLQPLLGSVGGSNDLGSLVGAVQTGFSSLLNDPSNAAQQGAVVTAAQRLTTQINAISQAYGQVRQSAQDDISHNIDTLNTSLNQIGALSDQIVALQAQGKSVADLQNLRNVQTATIAGLVNANFVIQSNGDMQVFTAGGAQLPTRAAALSIAAAQTGTTLYYPGGGLPGIMLGGTDVTGQMGGGAIAASLALRDTMMQTYQSELDEFSENLATRFQAQGLTLFSDGSGQVPTGAGPPTQAGYVGFASTITVNPQVVATPSLVRDGTQTVGGSATGASAFTPNPTGAAGFSTLIQRVLDYALGNQAQDNVPQPGAATTGLGPSGTLAAPFGGQGSIGDFANALTASLASDCGNAAINAKDATGTQTALAASVQAKTGVSMDTQLSLMVELQNAYGANAKIISTIQQMYTQLLQAV